MLSDIGGKNMSIDRKNIILALRIIAIIIVVLMGYLFFAQKISPAIAIPIMMLAMFLFVVADMFSLDFGNDKNKQKSRFKILHLIYFAILLMFILIVLCVKLFN